MSTPALARAAEADYLGRCGWTDDAKALWAAHPQVHESWQQRIRPVLSTALHDPDDPAWLPNVIAAAILDFHSGPSSQPLSAVVADAVRAAILGPDGR